MRTLKQIAARLEAGEPSRTLIDQCLDRIKDASGEGGRTFTKVYGEAARTTADSYDALRRRGATPSPFAGIPVSIKDLFDVAGDVTTAGSVALRQAPPATGDAAAVVRLRGAGFIPIGRTNMTEFAFSGLGLNPPSQPAAQPYARKAGPHRGGLGGGRRFWGEGEKGGGGPGPHPGRPLPHPGGAVRPGRLQADRQSHPDRRHHAAVADPRLDRH